MRLKYLILSALILTIHVTGQTTNAQEEIYDLGYNSQNSIVRYISGDSCIIYNETGAAASLIFSHLLNGSLVQESSLPCPQYVNDILPLSSSNLAYFCGAPSAYNAYFGYKTLSYPSSIAMSTALPAFVPYIVSSLDRLTAYKTTDGGVHIIMTGACYHRDTPNVLFSCIVDAYATNPTSPSWAIEMYTLGKPDWQFHDVAVSDNYIAVAGQTLEGNRPHRIYFFNKPPLVLQVCSQRPLQCGI